MGLIGAYDARARVVCLVGDVSHEDEARLSSELTGWYTPTGRGGMSGRLGSCPSRNTKELLSHFSLQDS